MSAAGGVQKNTKSRNPAIEDFRVSNRYRLQDAARNILGGRLNACCRAIATHRKNDTTPRRKDKVEVLQHKDGALSYGNLVKCGSVWVCPVCSAKIAQTRRVELTDLVDAVYKQGYSVSMLTLTVPHGHADTVKDTLDKMLHAKRLMQNRKPWKSFKQRVGLVGDVRTLEVTYGTANGWHPHFHIMLVHKSDVVMKGFGAAILKMWQDACITAGLRLPLIDGFNITQCEKRHSKALGDYICKFGIDYEMTHGAVSKNGKGRAPFQLLSDAAAGDRQAAVLFKLYADAFKGRRQLVFSRGLRADFGLAVELSDDEILDGSCDDLKLVYLIPRDDWRKMCRNNLRGQFLDYLRLTLSTLDAVLDDDVEKLRQSVLPKYGY